MVPFIITVLNTMKFEAKCKTELKQNKTLNIKYIKI